MVPGLFAFLVWFCFGDGVFVEGVCYFEMVFVPEYDCGCNLDAC